MTWELIQSGATHGRFLPADNIRALQMDNLVEVLPRGMMNSMFIIG